MEGGGRGCNAAFVALLIQNLISFSASNWLVLLLLENKWIDWQKNFKMRMGCIIFLFIELKIVSLYYYIKEDIGKHEMSFLYVRGWLARWLGGYMRPYRTKQLKDELSDYVH